MRRVFAGLALMATAAHAQGTAPLDGIWESRGLDARAIACGDELGPLVEAMGAQQLRTFQQTLIWNGQFDPRDIGIAPTHEGVTLNWTQPDATTWAAEMIGTGPDRPIGFATITMRLQGADLIDTRTQMDMTAMRIIGGRPVAPGTAGCTLILRVALTHQQDG